MNIILQDLENHLTFAPLTLTRPVGNLRVGIFTNDERYKLYFPDAEISFETEDYLRGKFPINRKDDNYWINGAVIPNEELVELIRSTEVDQTLIVNGVLVCHRGTSCSTENKRYETLDSLIFMKERWNLYQCNDVVLKTDFDFYTKDKQSFILSKSNTLIGPEENLFIDEGATIEGAIINVKNAPVYIGKNAEVMEGSLIRGGLALCDNAVLKMGAKSYGGTTIGPFCKVGGEVNNVIFHGYSNKGHEGFIGNSLIGEWCNLGADTNCSNLKNNYGTVKTHDYKLDQLEQTDVQFMGIMMGDHAKTGINTMFNTATVIGVSANVFGADFPPKYILNFSWGGHEGASKFDFDKSIEVANNMMIRRGKEMTSDDIKIFRELYT
jgi:UDP-N-acetylglucosamine diphosphorylase/glucosamine-1-phosphate N-acetyltransferase